MIRGTAPAPFCGDCLDVLATLPEASVDVIVTSPPYNLGIAYSLYGDSREEAEYLDWMVRVAAALRRVLQPDGSFFLNVAGLLDPALAAVRADRAAAAAVRAAEPYRLGEVDRASAPTASAISSRCRASASCIATTSTSST